MASENPNKLRHSVSPTGWWLASLLEHHQATDGLSKTVYWENYRLIRASGWREAFHKAQGFGVSDAAVGNEAFSYRQTFVGITDLVPIYDEFEDGAEILWKEYDASQEDNASSWVYSEEEMASIFDPELSQKHAAC